MIKNKYTERIDMSLFSKAPLLEGIDYDTNPSDWDATNTSTTAKLSLGRMKYKVKEGGDKKRQQQIREKSWYVDIPFFNKGVVFKENTYKIEDVEPEVKGRFYGKDPSSAKAMFETYFIRMKEQENKKLQEKLKGLKIKTMIKATEAAQTILTQGNPTPPSRDVTQVLSESELNPSSLESNSPFANFQVNSTNAPATRVSKLTPEEIQARKNASKTRKMRSTSKTINTTTFNNALASKAEQALSPREEMENPLISGIRSQQSLGTVNKRVKNTLQAYKSKTKTRKSFGTQKKKPISIAELKQSSSEENTATL